MSAGESVITNARLVLEDEVVHGTLMFSGGVIGAVDRGMSGLACALDAEGDFLAPGFIEMHTDNMERHFVPRPKVLWPARSGPHSPMMRRWPPPASPPSMTRFRSAPTRRRIKPIARTSSPR